MRQFNQPLALTLLVFLLVKALIVPVIFLNYELRKDFIIRNYCENKNRPELHCDGKCYLAKQIKAAQQEEENQAKAVFIDKLLGFECLSGTLFFLFDVLESERPHHNQVVFYFNCFFQSDYLARIFRPPCLFSEISKMY